MKIPPQFDLGVATHTGRVRATNEDDFLLVAPPSGKPFALLAAVADGLGGAAGGAEASRSGLRGLASAALSASDLALDEIVRRGFSAASERVAEQALLVPSLAEMATTLCAVVIHGHRAAIGHVGDSRVYLQRASVLRQLTVDHASKEDRNRLLRCIGGSAPDQQPDVTEIDLAIGDRLLLCSDGVWGFVPEADLASAMLVRDPRRAADRLVALSLQSGGADNATVVLVDVVGDEGSGLAAERELAREESSLAGEEPRARRLGAPRWPFFVLFAAAVALLLAWLRMGLGFNVFLWLQGVR